MCQGGLDNERRKREQKCLWRHWGGVPNDNVNATEGEQLFRPGALARGKRNEKSVLEKLKGKKKKKKKKKNWRKGGDLTEKIQVILNSKRRKGVGIYKALQVMHSKFEGGYL